jgi:hypothetical protein
MANSLDFCLLGKLDINMEGCAFVSLAKKFKIILSNEGKTIIVKITSLRMSV